MRRCKSAIFGFYRLICCYATLPPFLLFRAPFPPYNCNPQCQLCPTTINKIKILFINRTPSHIETLYFQARYFHQTNAPIFACLTQASF